MSRAGCPKSDTSPAQALSKTGRISPVATAYERSGDDQGPAPAKPRRNSRDVPPYDPGATVGDGGMEETIHRRKARVNKPLKMGSDGKINPDDGDPAPTNSGKPKMAEVSRTAEQFHFEFSYSKAVYDYVKSHKKSRRMSSPLVPVPAGRPEHPQPQDPVFAEGVILHHVHKIDLFGIPDDSTFIWEFAGPPDGGYSPRLHKFGDQAQDTGAKKQRQRKSWPKASEDGDAARDRRVSSATSDATDNRGGRGSQMETGRGSRRLTKDREKDSKHKESRKSSSDRETDVKGRRSSNEMDVDTRRSAKNTDTEDGVRKTSTVAKTNDSLEEPHFSSKTGRSSAKRTPVPLSSDRESKTHRPTFNVEPNYETEASCPKVSFDRSLDGRVKKPTKRRVSISLPPLNDAKSPLPPALTRRRHRRHNRKDVGFNLPALQCARLPAPRASICSPHSDKDGKEGPPFNRRKQSRFPK